MKDWLGNFQTVQLYRTLGLVRFIALFVGLLAVILPIVFLYSWLEGLTGWPDAYGFHCHRKCMIENLWHSPALLHQATWPELGLFALIWSMPAIVAGAFVYAFLKKRAARPIYKFDLTE